MGIARKQGVFWLLQKNINITNVRLGIIRNASPIINGNKNP
jgi:hypothetical protein